MLYLLFTKNYHNPPIPPSLASRNLKKSRVSETRLRQNADFWPQKMVSHSTVAKGYDLVETKSPATVKIDLDMVKSR